MMFGLKRFVRGACVLLSLLATSAYAQFISLHQFPITYVKSSGLDAQGNLFTVNSDPLLGFKNQFAPTGVSGCVLGYPEYRSQCQSVTGGLGFNFSGYSQFREFKAYIPAGTTFFSLTGNLPQNTSYAVAVRLGATPARVAAPTAAEYETLRSSQNTSTAFSRLQAGEELVMVHNYGGNISLSGEARLTGAPLTEGRWIYFRVLTGESIYLLGGIYEINRDAYATGYANTVFGADGDPTGGTCTNCNTGTTPPGGGTTTPPASGLTGVSLSASSLSVGASATSVTVSPVPATASLPSCTVSNSTLLQQDTLISALNPNAPVWRLNATAGAALTSPTTVVFTCGSYTANLVVNPAGFASSLTTQVETDANGLVSLRVNLTRGQAEFIAGGPVEYWVAGLIPVNAMFFTTDQWFFLASNASNALGWTQLTLPNPSSVVFKRVAAPSSASETLVIPLGFSKADAAPFRIQIHFGYRSGTGNFNNKGIIWDSTASN